MKYFASSAKLANFLVAVSAWNKVFKAKDLPSQSFWDTKILECKQWHHVLVTCGYIYIYTYKRIWTSWRGNWIWSSRIRFGIPKSPPESERKADFFYSLFDHQFSALKKNGFKLKKKLPKKFSGVGRTLWQRIVSTLLCPMPFGDSWMCSFSGHPLSMVEATFNKLLAATSKPTKKNKKVSITRLPLKEFKPQIWDTTEPLLEIIIDLSTFHQVSCVASREFTGNPFLQRLFQRHCLPPSFLAVQVRNPVVPWNSEVPFRITVFRSGWDQGRSPCQVHSTLEQKPAWPVYHVFTRSRSFQVQVHLNNRPVHIFCQAKNVLAFITYSKLSASLAVCPIRSLLLISLLLKSSEQLKPWEPSSC